MTTRRRVAARGLVGLLVCLLSLVVIGTALAQEPQPPPVEQQPTPDPGVPTTEAESEAAGEEEGERAFFEEGVPEEELNRIDELLEEDAVLLDTGFIYDSKGRRDPFRSLLRVAEEPSPLGPRPEGIPGLDIDEITVTGVWVTKDGPVAQIRSTGDVKSYLIRAGDQLYDGDVVRIEYIRGGASEVIFRQREEDPAAPKPFREVVKRLQP